MSTVCARVNVDFQFAAWRRPLKIYIENESNIVWKGFVFTAKEMRAEKSGAIAYGRRRKNQKSLFWGFGQWDIFVNDVPIAEVGKCSLNGELEVKIHGDAFVMKYDPKTGNSRACANEHFAVHQGWRVQARTEEEAVALGLIVALIEVSAMAG